MFDHPEESAGLFLKVATDEVSFEDIARTFTEVTGKQASHERISLQEFFPKVEPFPNAPANWAAGPNAPRDESSMTFRENFTPWWKYWGEGIAEKRNFELLDKIHPARIKSLREWMEKNGYDGRPKSILKGKADLQASVV